VVVVLLKRSGSPLTFLNLQSHLHCSLLAGFSGASDLRFSPLAGAKYASSYQYSTYLCRLDVLFLQVEIHEDFLQDCINRLTAMYDTVCVLERNNDNAARLNQETQRMIRVLTVLRVYINDCDEAYAEDRAILPLYR
jgi:hypothetical protein